LEVPTFKTVRVGPPGGGGGGGDSSLSACRSGGGAAGRAAPPPAAVAVPSGSASLRSIKRLKQPADKSCPLGGPSAAKLLERSPNSKIARIPMRDIAVQSPYTSCRCKKTIDELIEACAGLIVVLKRTGRWHSQRKSLIRRFQQAAGFKRET
jgi:ribosomal protein L34E